MPTPLLSSDIAFIDAPNFGLADSLISDVRWAENTISFSFPDNDATWSPDPYTGYGPGQEPWSPLYKPFHYPTRPIFRNLWRNGKMLLTLPSS